MLFVAALTDPDSIRDYRIDGAWRNALTELNLLGFPDVQLEVSREVDLGEGWVLSEFVSFGTNTGLRERFPGQMGDANPIR